MRLNRLVLARKRACAGLAFLTLAALPVAAQDLTPAQKDLILFDCTFRTGQARDGNWVSPRVMIFRRADGDGLLVFDGVIQEVEGAPIAAVKTDETQLRVTYGWEIDAQDSAGQPVRMIYRLTHYRDGKPAKVTVTPRGYDNSFSGSGRCSVARDG
jgi:hypothetical protein